MDYLIRSNNLRFFINLLLNIKYTREWSSYLIFWLQCNTTVFSSKMTEFLVSMYFHLSKFLFIALNLFTETFKTFDRKVLHKNMSKLSWTRIFSCWTQWKPFRVWFPFYVSFLNLPRSSSNNLFCFQWSKNGKVNLPFSFFFAMNSFGRKI